jgi:alkaline phosphatase
MIKKFLATSLILFLLLSCTSTHKTYSYKPKTSAAKNIIFMIVDGMGFEYVKAAHIYNGQKPMSFERFHCKTSVTTCAYEGASADGHCDSHSSHITDSAAAATAIATGFKVSNGVISRRLPGKDNDIESILEYAKTKNKSTGVIATKLFTDATPAAFISHVKDRGDTEEILTDIFSQSLPNVVFGSDNDKHVAAAQKAILPYNFAKNTSELRSLARSINDGPSCHGSDCPHIYGGFGYHEAILGATTINKDCRWLLAIKKPAKPQVCRLYQR